MLRMSSSKTSGGAKGDGSNEYEHRPKPNKGAGGRIA